MATQSAWSLIVVDSNEIIGLTENPSRCRNANKYGILCHPPQKIVQRFQSVETQVSEKVCRGQHAPPPPWLRHATVGMKLNCLSSSTHGELNISPKTRRRRKFVRSNGPTLLSALSEAGRRTQLLVLVKAFILCLVVTFLKNSIRPERIGRKRGIPL